MDTPPMGRRAAEKMAPARMVVELNTVAQNMAAAHMVVNMAAHMGAAPGQARKSPAPHRGVATAAATERTPAAVAATAGILAPARNQSAPDHS